MNRRGYEKASTALKDIEVNKILTKKQAYSLVFLMTRVTLIVTVRHTCTSFMWLFLETKRSKTELLNI